MEGTVPGGRTVVLIGQIYIIIIFKCYGVLRSAISASQLPDDWEIMEIDGSYYLLRMIGIGKARLGTLISVSSLLGAATSFHNEDIALYVTTQDNCLYGPDRAAECIS